MEDVPVAKALANDSTVANTPANEFETNEPTPLAIPIPPSMGPLTNPVMGLSTKSIQPFIMFLTRPTRFPKIPKLPSTFKIDVNPSSL